MRNIKLHCWAIFFKNLALHFFNEEENANSEAINYWFGEQTGYWFEKKLSN